MSQGQGGGAPAKWSDPVAFAARCDEYFAECDKVDQPYTVPDLAYFLGFNCRQMVWEYGKKPRFTDAIKRARLRIEGQRNRMMLSGTKSPIGCIFDLKNNFAWQDKQEIETKQEVTVTKRMVEAPPTPTSLAEWQEQVRLAEEARQKSKGKDTKGDTQEGGEG